MKRACFGAVWHVVCVSTTGCPVLSCSISALRLLLSSYERVWVVLVSTTGCPVLSFLTTSSWQERVSISWDRDVFLSSCAVLVLVPTTGCPVLSVPTTGLPVLSRPGFGIGWFDWRLLDCCTTCSSGRWASSELNSLSQSCFKEIFGGGRGDIYTFSYMPSPISIKTTFGIQYNNLEVFREEWSRSIESDKTSILSSKQDWCRPNTLCIGVSSMFYACIVHDAVHSSRSCQDPCDFSPWDPQAERRLSVCCSDFDLPVSIPNWEWNVNWLHIQHGECTGRSCSE